MSKECFFDMDLTAVPGGGRLSWAWRGSWRRRDWRRLFRARSLAPESPPAPPVTIGLEQHGEISRGCKAWLLRVAKSVEGKQLVNYITTCFSNVPINHLAFLRPCVL